MARWYRRYRRSSYRRSGKKWNPVTQVIRRITGAGQRQDSASTGTYSVGPIMKVKNFRINIVFA